MTTDVKQIYVESLRNTHAAEKQGLVQIEQQLKGLDDYPDYAALLRAHVQTTSDQLGRIEAALGDAGGGTAGLREAVTKAAGAVGAAVHGVMPDATLKNLYAGYAFQHEQVAAYLSLAEIADAAGFPQHRGWIGQSLEEERRAAREVEAIVAPVTRAFLARAAR